MGIDQTLRLDNPTSFKGTFFDLRASDTIDLPGIGVPLRGLFDDDDVLTIEAAETNVSLNFDLSKDYSEYSFFLLPDALKGTEVVIETDTTTASFEGINEILLAIDPANFVGQIDDFEQGDTIDLVDLSATSATLGSDGDLVIVEQSGSILTLSLGTEESYNGYSFIPLPDGNGGTDITLEHAPSLSLAQSVTAYETADMITPQGSIAGQDTFSAAVSLSATDVQFTAARAGNVRGQSVPIIATYIGGDLNPNGYSDFNPDGYNDVDIVPQDASSYYDVTGLLGLGPSFVSGTLSVSIGQYYLEGNDPQVVPLVLSYEDQELDASYSPGTIDLTVDLEVYNPAIAQYSVASETQALSLSSADIGGVHVGQAGVFSVRVTNEVTGALSDTLVTSPGTLGSFVAENGVRLSSGQMGTIGVTFTASAAGMASANQMLFDPVTHDTALPDQEAEGGFGLQIVAFNYAQPVLVNSTLGTVDANTGAVAYSPSSIEDGYTLFETGSSDYTLDFGDVYQLPSTEYSANILVENAAPDSSYSDSLSGSLVVSGGGFYDSVSTSTGTITGGEVAEFGDFQPDLETLGSNTLEVVYYPSSSDSYTGTTTLPEVTLTVTDDVLAPEIQGATITTFSNTVTVYVDSDQVAEIDPLFAAASSSIDYLTISGSGAAELDSQVLISGVEVGSDSNLFLEGGSLLTDPIAVENGANIIGNGTIGGQATINGTVTAASGVLDITGDVTGDGTLTFLPGATLRLEGTISGTEALAFTGSREALIVGSQANIMSTVVGAVDGDTIALDGQQVASAIYDTGNSTLAILSSGGTTYSLALAGTYQGNDFTVVNGEINVSCFVSGTSIATLSGSVCVEDLTVGALVHVEFAGVAPIQWIGYRRIDCREHSAPKTVWPIRISAHSFGANQPSRDLWLSPDHSVYIEGVLIPVRYLVNGDSVAQERRDEITYWHVELERHDVVFAEGLPCETFLDTGNRHSLGGERSAWQPPADFASRVWETQGCAPLVVTGPHLETVRSRLRDITEGLRSGGSNSAFSAPKCWAA